MTRFRIWPFPIPALALFIAGGVPALAQVELEVVAVTGEFAHGGGGGQFSHFDRPVLNENGDIAFRASLRPGFGGVTEANQKGIWRKRPFTQVHKIARAGDYTSPFKPYGPQPEVTVARYGTLGDPLIGPDGRVTFHTHLQLPSEDSHIGPHNNEMIFTMKGLSAGMLDVAQEKGSKAPNVRYDYEANRQSILDDEGKRTWFDTIRPPVLAPDGTLAFISSLQLNNFDGKKGIWFYCKPEGADPVVIHPNFAIIDGFKEFNSISVQTTQVEEIDGGGFTTDVAFHATLDQRYGHPGKYSDDGIWKIAVVPDGSQTQLTRIAVAGEIATWGEANHDSDYFWDELGKPALAEGGITVFRATLSLIPGKSGIPRREGIVWLGRFPLALSGDLAAGFASDFVYDSFEDPSITPDGKIVFCAHLKDTSNPEGPPVDAIYFKEGGGFASSLLVRSGRPAPGAGGAVFGNLGSPLVNDRGDIAFSANLDPTADAPARYGLWVIPHGQPISLVAISGSSVELPNGTSSPIQWVEATAMNSEGQIALRIRFEDGAESVAVADTDIGPPPAPDFESWARENIADADFRGTGDDPDRDGIPNFLEFAYGGNPMVPDPFRSPKLGTGVDPYHWNDYDGEEPPPFLTLTYFELANKGTLKYVVEKSPDLIGWTTATTSIWSRSLEPDGTYRVTTNLNQNPGEVDGRVFFRLQVTDTP